jgi:hypothetical protein
MQPQGYYVGATAIAMPLPSTPHTQVNQTVTSVTAPPGCSITVNPASNTATVVFNTYNASTVQCGADSGGGGSDKQSAGIASSLIQFGLVGTSAHKCDSSRWSGLP